MKRLTVVLAVSFALSACGSEDGGDDDELPFEPTLSEIQTNVFDISCVFSSCHSTQGNKGDLILEPGVSQANLVGVDVDNPAAAAMSLDRVVAGDASSSFLMMKLTKPVATEFGDLMPQGSLDGLSQGKLDAIAQWIDDGAMDD
jgi:ABC-type amino acid transport substrate-binding protein